MITVIHGGQTGVDRGAHEAAIDNGWRVAGYMPRDARDENGPIPVSVARWLWVHEKAIYAARTAANVRSCDALLVVVSDAEDPRKTPGTAKTIDLAADRHVRQMVADPRSSARMVAQWIWRDLLSPRTLSLPFDTQALDLTPARLMVAGPRESKWPGARVETAGLLRRVGHELLELSARKEAPRAFAGSRRDA